MCNFPSYERRFPISSQWHYHQLNLHLSVDIMINFIHKKKWRSCSYICFPAVAGGGRRALRPGTEARAGRQDAAVMWRLDDRLRRLTARARAAESSWVDFLRWIQDIQQMGFTTGDGRGCQGCLTNWDTKRQRDINIERVRERKRDACTWPLASKFCFSFI